MTKSTKRKFQDVPWPPLLPDGTLRIDKRNHLLVLAEEAALAFEALMGIKVKDITDAARARAPAERPWPPDAKVVKGESGPGFLPTAPPRDGRQGQPTPSTDPVQKLRQIVREFETCIEQADEMFHGREAEDPRSARGAGRIRQSAGRLLQALKLDRGHEARLLRALRRTGWSQDRVEVLCQMLTELADAADLIESSSRPSRRTKRGDGDSASRNKGGRRPETFRPAVQAAAEVLEPVSRGDVRLAVALLFTALELVDDLWDWHDGVLLEDFDALESRVRMSLAPSREGEKRRRPRKQPCQRRPARR